MSQFTLLESGTTRAHFQLAKRLEDAPDHRTADLAILDTVASIRHKLANQSPSDASGAADTLLPLLHCLHHYPLSPLTTQSLDISFALLPALQLVSLSTRWSHLLVGYALLAFLVPSADTTFVPAAASTHAPAGDLVDVQSSTSASEPESAVRITEHRDRGLQGPSLLLNTFRKHLVEGGKDRSHRSSSFASSAFSSSRPRRASPSSLLRISATLASVAAGIPSGTSVLPSLATPLLCLTSHRDAKVRKDALNAMWRCATYEEDELLQDADAQEQGGTVHSLLPLREGGEMIQAALQVAREMFASPQALEQLMAKSEGPSQRDALLQVRTRAEAEPSVLRAALRVVELARQVHVLSPVDAIALASNALHLVGWTSSSLLDVGRCASDTLASAVRALDDRRVQIADQTRATLGQDHDYHGLRAPWVVMASLDSIAASLASSALEAAASLDAELRARVFAELERSLLCIYRRASQGSDASLAVCVSAARCLGQLHRHLRRDYRCAASALQTDSFNVESLASLWQSLSQHVKLQLISPNANRKVAALRLLDALVPTGWAGTADIPDAAIATVAGPFSLDERDMAMLMSLLSDRDETVRRYTLRLLDGIDDSLIGLHLRQLTKTLEDVPRDRASAKEISATAERLLEAGYIKTFGAPAAHDYRATLEQQGQSYANIICSVGTKVNLGAAGASTAIIERVLKDYRGLPIAARLSMLLNLIEAVSRSNEGEPTKRLTATLCCDLEVADLAADWPSKRALASSLSTLVDALISAADNAETRDSLLAAIARIAALVSSSSLEGKGEQLSLRLRKVAEATTSSSPSGAFKTRAENVAFLLQQLPTRWDTTQLTAPYQTVSNILETLLTPLEGGDNTVKQASSSSYDPASGHSKVVPLSTPSTAAPRGVGQAEVAAAAATSTRSHRSLVQSPLNFSDDAPSSFAATSSSTSSRRPLRFEQYSTAPTAKSASSSSSSLSSSLSSRRKQLNAAATSAIPSRDKRERDSHISSIMSSSIAKLVMGDEDGGSVSTAGPHCRGEDTVLFSASADEGDDSDHPELLPTIESRRDVVGDTFAIDVKAGQEPSYLDIVHQCHNCDPWTDDTLHPFVLDGAQIGFLKPEVMQACECDVAWRRDQGLPPVLKIGRFNTGSGSSGGVKKAVTFDDTLSTPDARSEWISSVCTRWRDLRLFPDPLDGWRSELYGVYGAPSSLHSRNTIAFRLERAACALFGVATFGVHLTAYTPSYLLWVPRRAATKSTWPGYLDNSVAGGIVAGDLPFKSMVRECEEEASLEPEYTRERIKTTGVLSYIYKTKGKGWIQPEVEYVYDLKVEEETVLKPCDGEAEGFERMGVDEVKERMKAGEFKANCSLVLIDFFIRHNLLTPEEEPHYCTIVAQLHTDLRLPGP